MLNRVMPDGCAERPAVVTVPPLTLPMGVSWV